jgi:long-chain-fatty-acid--CoA ligase ACSBG
MFASSPEGIPIRYGADPISNTRLGLVTDLLFTAAASCPDHPALTIERPSGRWIHWTWRRYADDATAFAAALLGDPDVQLDRFEAVIISAFGAPEWSIAQMGTIHAGGLAAGVFTSNGLDTTEFLVRHSCCAVAVVDTEAQLEKFLRAATAVRRSNALLNGARGLRKIVVAGANSSAIVAKFSPSTDDAAIVSWDTFLATGRKSLLDPQAPLTKRVSENRVEQACVLIYTSGTTGTPKAVMITHDNVMFQLLAGVTLNKDATPAPGSEEHTVAYLPLSHIAGQIVDIFRPMFFTATHGAKATVHFARPDAMRGTLVETLRAVRPTKFIGVPRVWEKFAASIDSMAAAQPAMRQLLDHGILASEARQRRLPAPPPPPPAVAAFQQRVQQGLGLDRVQFATTAAAPISSSTLRTLAGVGIDVLEVYGMSECAGATTASTRDLFRWGAVGVKLPGTDLRVDHVPGRDIPGEGEVCFRGRHIMLGYFREPAKTAEAIDKEGWLHSGDVGRICPSSGLLTITGRLKELLITAGGENIAPVPIEQAIKNRCPGLSHVVVVGDRMPYLVCLVTIKTKPDLSTGYFTNELADEALSVSAGTKVVEQAMHDPLWMKTIEKAIKDYNSSDECVHNNHRVHRFAILPRDLSVPGGELTPTMKLRRAAILDVHKAQVERLYREPSTGSKL